MISLCGNFDPVYFPPVITTHLICVKVYMKVGLLLDLHVQMLMCRMIQSNEFLQSYGPVNSVCMYLTIKTPLIYFFIDIHENWYIYRSSDVHVLCSDELRFSPLNSFDNKDLHLLCMDNFTKW